MKPRTTTIIVMAIVFVGVVAYDIITYNLHGRRSTISDIVLDWSIRYPLATHGGTFLTGYLPGHTTWPQWRKRKDPMEIVR